MNDQAILMPLQDWFNVNHQKDNLIWHSAGTAQIIWVRDTLTYLLKRADKETQCFVSSTHTSKSVELPVYRFKVNTWLIQIRCNFHDWCVRIDKEIDIPDYVNPRKMQGYYEGITNQIIKTDFCVNSQEEMYAILWWLTLRQRSISSDIGKDDE